MRLHALSHSASDRLRMGSAKMALVSQSHNTITCWCPREDFTGSLPVRSMAISCLACTRTHVSFVLLSSFLFGLPGAAFLVERMPCLCCRMWPFGVMCDFGRCLRIDSGVSPGHAEQWLFSMAAIQVCATGCAAAAWRNSASSAFVVVWCALFA